MPRAILTSAASSPSARALTAVLLLTLCAIAGLGFGAPRAQGQTVTHGLIDAAAIDGQFVYFTKPASRSEGSAGSKQVVRFDRVSRLTQSVFVAPSDARISAFMVNAGVLAVLLDPDPSDDVGTATVLTMALDGSDRREIATVVDDGKSLPCFEYLGLASVTDSGQTVMNRVSNKPADGTSCETSRVTVAANAANREGVVSTLREETSGVYSEKRSPDGAIGFVFSRIMLEVTDEWLVQASQSRYDLVFTDRSTGLIHKRRADAYGQFDAFHVWPDGSYFLAKEGDPNRAYVARVSSRRKPSLIIRRNAFSQMRSCADQIVELYQRHRGLRSESRLRLALRDRQGKVVRVIRRTVPRGSTIEDCDASGVLLSYHPSNLDVLAAVSGRSSRRPRLFTVPL